MGVFLQILEGNELMGMHREGLCSRCTGTAKSEPGGNIRTKIRTLPVRVGNFFFEGEKNNRVARKKLG